MNLRTWYILLFALFILACSNPKPETVIRLVTLDPGHFHAALVQQSRYPGVDTNVYVFAPEGPDLIQHLERVDAFNTRPEKPTDWVEHIYVGPDYLDKMTRKPAGNVVVIAGNNRLKAEYITRSLKAGMNVLSDKPMIILPEEFPMLEAAFETAADKELLLYDIMTERFEATSMLQRELARSAEVFGDLQPGTPESPSVIKESVHHFRKLVSGKPLRRPAWFFDTRQQGEGIVDVTTHLVDLVQWTCFPEEAIDFRSDIRMIAAERTATELSAAQFREVTGLSQYPDFLAESVRDSALSVFSNGSFTYTLRGVHARVSVRWDYFAGEGKGDTHYSMMRGSKATLVIRQGDGPNSSRPMLYVEPVNDTPEFSSALDKQIQRLTTTFPGLSYRKEGKGYRLVIPEALQTSHEAHFSQVMEKYIACLRGEGLPDWEVPNMLAKYYTTTEALRMAKK